MFDSNRQRGDRRVERATLPIVEALEGRQLLAASLDHGLLTVSGTANDDTIVVAMTRQHGWQYVVDLNGQRSSFPARLVKKIRVLGRAGNDRIAVGKKGPQIKANVSVNAGPGKNVVLMPKQTAQQSAQPTGEQPPSGGQAPPSGEQPTASDDQPPVTPPTPPDPPTPPTPPQDPPPQDPPPTDPEEPLNVRPFTVYSNIRFQGTPDLSGYGLQPIMVMYNDIYPLLPSGVYDFEHPDEALTRSFARNVAAKGCMAALDIEQWVVDLRSVTQDVALANLQHLYQVIDWMHDEVPGLKLGLYSILPVDTMALATHDTPESRAAIDQSNAFLSTLFTKVDILFPMLYPWTTNANNWLTASRYRVEYARQYNKPVIPFIRPDYCSFAGLDIVDQSIPDGYWRMQLDSLRKYADGVIIWTNHYGTWDEQATWWSILKDFIHETPRLPAAPADLIAAPGPTSITISWMDNSDNEGEFVVERSSDGVNFSPYCTVPANTTSWTDMDITRRYEYRVRATNSFGQSDVTNSDGALPYRLATSTTQAEGFDAGSGWPIRSANWAAWGLGRDQWIRFDKMAFNRPVSTFLANLASPMAGNGQKLEIHLDAPDGPTIGTLVLQAAPSFWQPIRQSTSVNAVVGVHDLYLVGRGDWGTAGLDWFVFQ